MKTILTIKNLTQSLCLFASLLASNSLLAQQDLTAPQDAAPFTSATRYDQYGRPAGTLAPDPDGAGNLHYLATRTTYNSDGLVDKIESGVLDTWPSDPSATFPSLSTVVSSKVFGYDTYGRKISESTYDKSNNRQGLTEFNYYDIEDANPAITHNYGHIQCQVVRINLTTNNDACNPVTGADGQQDRVTRYTYDPLDQVLTEERAVGTDQAQTYVTNTYSGRLLKTQTDANNHTTTLEYDGSLLLKKRIYPYTSANPNDYNEFLYDLNGNLTSERKRNGNVITYSYDDNNRKTHKIMPTSSQSVDYTYDLRGLVLTSTFSATGKGITNSFDGFGHLASSTNNMNPSASRTLSYTYDDNGNRETVKHPDGVLFKYTFDGLNRVLGVNDGSTDMVTLNYAHDGRRSNIKFGQNTYATYNFQDGLHLDTFAQDFTGSNDDLTTTFAYNHANQITTFTCSNSAYCYQGNSNRTGIYEPDALNRYSKIAGQSMGYDLNSNMTDDGTSTYSYDDENRMLTASKANSSFIYDPLGRLFETTINGSKTQFLYDGDALVAEYNGSNVQTRRYVHGDQVDEPWVEYESGSISDAPTNRLFLHANHQGSIIARSDKNGIVVNKQSYDSYGIPSTGDVGRFGYTGQIVFKELGLNYYKARVYSPTIGRFLQTDPIGYKDDMDLYSYVGNDPMNYTDPSGRQKGDPTDPDEIVVTGSSCGSGGCHDKEVDAAQQFVRNLQNAGTGSTSVAQKIMTSLLKDAMANESSDEASDDSEDDSEDEDEDKEETPTTDKDNFEHVKGASGKKHKDSGEIWEKDKLHKDHYEVYKNKKNYDKGRRDRDVWLDGRSKRKF